MQFKRLTFWFVLIGLTLVTVSVLALMTVQPASAQCGSQASSCKNCHEVQGQMPVNNDGSAWHKSHAFGDFCYICHAGNQQATDAAAAHTGMVPPLQDIKASCQQCHVNDLEARSQVYAAALGVEIGSGSGNQAAAGNEPAAPVTESAPAAAASVSNCNEIVVDDPNLVDYAAHYEQVVLGKKPVNWGNVILLVMIAGLVVGGGGFVVTREKLINIKFGDTRAVDAEYPADVVEMLPKIAGLKPASRKALKNVLETKKAEKVLDLLDEVIKKDEE